MKERLTIKLLNAHRAPLEDTARILVYRHRDLKLVGETTRPASGSPIFVEGLRNDEVYLVRVYPSKHRPVLKFARNGQRVVFHCPVRPEKVRRVHVYAMGELEQLIRNHEDLEREQVASALNLWAKLKQTRVGTVTAESWVERIERVESDRVYFYVDPKMIDAVKEAGDEFISVSGLLHHRQGFEVLESFKSTDHYGNLQLTFLQDLKTGEVLVDADIDETGGLAHLFQVVRNTLTGRTTHPYDVHEILTYHQEIDTGYLLRT